MDKSKSSDSDKTKGKITDTHSELDKKKGTEQERVKTSQGNSPKSGTDSRGTFATPKPVATKKVRTLTDSSGTEDSASKTSVRQSQVAMVELTTGSSNQTVDLDKTKTADSSHTDNDDALSLSFSGMNQDLTGETVQQELRLSSSTDDSEIVAVNRKGPNVKYTKKKRLLGSHSRTPPPAPTFSRGPWVCRLCAAEPLQTASGIRRHYWCNIIM